LNFHGQSATLKGVEKRETVEPFLHIAWRAARAAGNLIDRNFQKLRHDDIQAKGKNDFVTRVDREAEAIINRIVLNEFPGHRILAEEGGYSGNPGDHLWVIDPLDGTTNFIQGIPHFAVSIALLEKGRPVLGLIYNPLSRECFHAISGRGAFLNKAPIVVSRTAKVNSALGATGFPFKAPQHVPAYTDAFRNLLTRCKDMRRCGSAALDLAYTACGRYDFFWEAHLLPWDFMAGKLIIEEAGGRTGDFLGKELTVQTSSLMAANQILYPKLLKIIRAYFK
jgi:myo-inositol-1(or 4)-monophosphatase